MSTPCCQISTPYRLVVSEYELTKKKFRIKRGLFLVHPVGHVVIAGITPRVFLSCRRVPSPWPGPGLVPVNRDAGQGGAHAERGPESGRKGTTGDDKLDISFMTFKGERDWPFSSAGSC